MDVDAFAIKNGFRYRLKRAQKIADKVLESMQQAAKNKQCSAIA
jgi:hypothetical protein